VIRYLRHKEIDFQKWDVCIDAAINGLPYASSWYLDIACEENWDALVLDDYDAVFPLPFKNRIIYKQLYQPFFLQQLGLFYKNADQHQQLNYFIEQLPAQFRKINLQLNTQNYVQSTFLKLKHKCTHHIILDKTYAEQSALYNTNTKRNLKKAQSYHFAISKNITPAQLTVLRKKYLGDELKGIQDEADFLRLQRLMEKALSINHGFINGITDADGEMLAVVFYLTGHNHIIYLNAISSADGKEKQAMTYLIDALIRDNAGTKQVFDFEGSMIPGVARFYKGFGAEEIPYPVIIK